MKTKSFQNSIFWLGEDVSSLEDDTQPIDIYQLAKYRRAIANFVFILTGRNIPVRFSSKRESFTDNKVIHIGGDLANGEFDVTVGLACHEASHIIFNEFFTLVKLIWLRYPPDIFSAADKRIDKNQLAEFTKEIYNWIEDRYIDDYICKVAPGYRGYYKSLYDKYFNLPKITSILKSDNFRDPTINSYRVRVINLVNTESDLLALPGLKEIYDLIDIPNISRLSTPKDRLNLTYDVVRIIVRELLASDELDNSSSNDENESSQEPGSVDESVLGDPLPPDVEKQISFLGGASNRLSVSPSTMSQLEILEKLDVQISTVGGQNGVPKVECVIVKNMTRQLMCSNNFPMVAELDGMDTQNDDSVIGINRGMALGSSLARKLRIRGESKTTISTRKPSGKLDNRLLAELGFSNENVFYTKTVSSYKNVHLHISVDASSSMESKWQRTMTLLTTLAKAFSSIPTLNIVISFRSSIGSFHDLRPYTVIAYDSRVDRISKIPQLFSYLTPHGFTPEGLSFESILDMIPSSDDVQDVIFINLSDGVPMFKTSDKGNDIYKDEIAWTHTKRQMDKLRSRRVEIISYYIDDGVLTDSENRSKSVHAFRQMYGRDSHVIDVESVVEIANVINKKVMSTENSR